MGTKFLRFLCFFMNFYLQDFSGSVFSCFLWECWLLACFDKNIKKIKLFFVSLFLGFLLVVVLELRKHNLLIWTDNYFGDLICWLLKGFDLWLFYFWVDFYLDSWLYLDSARLFFFLFCLFFCLSSAPICFFFCF